MAFKIFMYCSFPPLQENYSINAFYSRATTQQLSPINYCIDLCDICSDIIVEPTTLKR